ncbi:MAG TPA: MFS transporter [Clostridiales bacterium]|nr:MFS transporter [Clostridiales bacterium]
MKNRTKIDNEEKSTRLSREAKILLLVGGLFTTATSLSGTFVNVYLWRAKNDLSMIGVFNLFQFIFIPIAFYLAGRMTKARPASLCLRIGLLLHMAFFLLILASRGNAPTFVIPLGTLLGLAAGFYWSAYQILTYDLTSRMNRDTYNSILGIIFSASNIITPVASGYIISKMPQFSGYRLIFMISAAIYTAVWLISLMMTAKPLDRPVELFKCWRSAASVWRYTLLGHYFFGIRNGVLMFLVNLLILISGGNEFTIGKLAMAASIVSAISFSLLEKILKPKRRILLFTIGAVMMLVSVSFLVFDTNLFTLLAYGLLNALFAPFFQVPFDSATLNVIDKNVNQSRTEYIILKEFSLNAGRITGVLIFLTLTRQESPTLMRILLLTVGSIHLTLLLFRKKLDFDVDVTKNRVNIKNK